MEVEIEQYLSHIKNVRRYSPHTLKAYQTDLKQFSTSCGKALLEVTRNDVRDFLLSIKSKGYALRSINRKLEVLRSFYRHYRRFTEYNQFPCALIRAYRFTKPRAKYLTKVEVKCVLDEIKYGSDRKLMRDRLVLELLYQTGCRASEVINLRKNEIDLHRKLIRVLGKGNIQRIVPLGNRVVELIGKYLKLWERKNQTEYLLTTDHGKQMYPMFLWRLIKRYFSTPGVSAHTLRHSCSTHLYHNRAPIKAIRDLLGHRSLRSTETYLHLDITHLIKIHTESHPKSGPVRQRREGLCWIASRPRRTRGLPEVSPRAGGRV